MDDVRFVSLAGIDGWLDVRRDLGSGIQGTKFSLPYYLKVRVTSTANNREYFTVLEGPHKGEKASVARKSPTESWLVAGMRQGPPAVVNFSLKERAIFYNGQGPFSAFSGEWSNGNQQFTAIPAGHYEINIPDSPHDKTRHGYYTYTKYHKTWFPINHARDARYIHVGEISDGCVTARAFIYDFEKNGASSGAAIPPDFSDLHGAVASNQGGALGMPYPKSMPSSTISWDDLYTYLIRSRINDDAVGTLLVK